jgi:hypothetical protein
MRPMRALSIETPGKIIAMRSHRAMPKSNSSWLFRTASICTPALAANAQQGAAGGSVVLPDYARAQSHTSLKQSTYDRIGGNRDSRPVEPGGTLEVFNSAGPGVISHTWFTIAAQSRMHLKQVVLRQPRRQLLLGVLLVSGGALHGLSRPASRRATPTKREIARLRNTQRGFEAPRPKGCTLPPEVDGGDREPENLFDDCRSSAPADRRCSLSACHPRRDDCHSRGCDPHVAQRGRGDRHGLSRLRGLSAEQ